MVNKAKEKEADRKLTKDLIKWQRRMTIVTGFLAFFTAMMAVATFLMAAKP